MVTAYFIVLSEPLLKKVRKSRKPLRKYKI